MSFQRLPYIAVLFLAVPAFSATPAVPEVPAPIEVGAAPVIDGANGSELCKILASVPMGPARDNNVFSVTAAEYGRMTGAQAACIVGLVSTVGQIDHVRLEAWQRMGSKDVLGLIAQWGNVDAKLKAAGYWMRAHGDAPGAEVLPVLQAVPCGPVRDGLILGIAGPRYAQMDSRVAAQIVSLLSVVGVVDRVPREAWARLEHQDVEWLLTQWKNPSVQPVVVQKWMDAHRA